MQNADQETMTKRVVTKEDGRTLIYYTFTRPSGDATAETATGNTGN